MMGLPRLATLMALTINLHLPEATCAPGTTTATTPTTTITMNTSVKTEAGVRLLKSPQPKAMSPQQRLRTRAMAKKNMPHRQ